jgi:galactokinase
VNLIGDHTDYTDGLVLPMAIDRATTIDWAPSDKVHLVSADDPDPASFDLHTIDSSDVASLKPRWARYPAAVVAVMRAQGRAVTGVDGRVSTHIPVGAGLSSSAALEVASALAFGFEGDPVDLALLCREAEHLATGVPTGIMDQLCITSARAGHATLIDCRSLHISHVEIPPDISFVVRFVAHRTLEGSEYADRVAECAKAEAVVGPLRDAALTDLARIVDHTVRQRARHVVSENQRVVDFADALKAGDFAAAGALMTDSHRSLDTDFGVSTPVMNHAVADLVSTPGVLGARMTGGGFGGCVVAMCRPGTKVAGWGVAPSAGPLVGR